VLTHADEDVRGALTRAIARLGCAPSTESLARELGQSVADVTGALRRRACLAPAPGHLAAVGRASVRSVARFVLGSDERYRVLGQLPVLCLRYRGGARVRCDDSHPLWRRGSAGRLPSAQRASRGSGRRPHPSQGRSPSAIGGRTFYSFIVRQFDFDWALTDSKLFCL